MTDDCYVMIDDTQEYSVTSARRKQYYPNKGYGVKASVSNLKDLLHDVSVKFNNHFVCLNSNFLPNCCSRNAAAVLNCIYIVYLNVLLYRVS